MGKKWIKQNSGSRTGGAGGHSHQDVSSCRGHGVILGTCDTARERETTVELVRLLNLAIEDLENSGVLSPHLSGGDGSSSSSGGSGSSSNIADLIAQEVRQAKTSQAVTSINTNTKGCVLIKISLAVGQRGGTPVALIRAIFDRVRRTKQSSSKHICRLIPLTHTFFPDEDDLQANARACLQAYFPAIALPPPVCRRHLIVERERIKEEKRKADREKKDARQRAFDAKKAEEGGGGGEGVEAHCVDDEGGGADEGCGEGGDEEGDGGGDGGEQPEAGRKRPHTEVARSASDPPAANDPYPDPNLAPAPVVPAADAVAYPPFTYILCFAARNHDVLSKHSSMAIVR